MKTIQVFTGEALCMSVLSQKIKIATLKLKVITMYCLVVLEEEVKIKINTTKMHGF